MGKRSRKQRVPARAQPAARAAPAAPKPPSRTELKNEAARRQLEPLEPGERPRAVTIGAAVTFLTALANLIAYLAGDTIQGKRPAAAGIIAFTVLMLVMTWGLWRARYWAVLGLEALLGLLLVIFSLFALRISSLGDVLISVGVLIPAGALFWYLIKAMARIQMPERPGR
ncbi:MAG: hypothetical protein QOF37_744 [Thermoleophilaceae bacterium]|nr:hypothetical protein [Thermoleophilaceae bacterium]